MLNKASVEVGSVSGWELSSVRFRPRAPLDSMFVVVIGDEYFHGVSAQGDVFWRVTELEHAFKPGSWMQVRDVVCEMATLSNTDPGDDLSLFDSVFLTDFGLLKLFAASISKGRSKACNRLLDGIRVDDDGRLKAAKVLKIELTRGGGALVNVPSVDNLKLAPALAKAVSKMQSESGMIGGRVQRNMDIYRILSHVSIRITKSKATSLNS